MWDDSTKKMMCRGLKMIHEDYPDAIIVGEVPPVLREEMLKYPSLMYRDHRGIV
jgi:hypothetical protein